MSIREKWWTCWRNSPRTESESRDWTPQTSSTSIKAASEVFSLLLLLLLMWLTDGGRECVHCMRYCVLCDGSEKKCVCEWCEVTGVCDEEGESYCLCLACTVILMWSFILKMMLMMIGVSLLNGSREIHISLISLKTHAFVAWRWWPIEEPDHR